MYCLVKCGRNDINILLKLYIESFKVMSKHVCVYKKFVHQECSQNLIHDMSLGCMVDILLFHLFDHLFYYKPFQIEPESQTRLLDATMNMEGVLLAGVPGAGGFDAIFAVTLGDASSTNLTKAWSSHNVLAMLVREDPRGVSLQSSDPRATEVTSGISAVHIE